MLSQFWIVAFAITLVAPSIWACSCGKLRTCSLVAQASAVFVGKSIAVDKRHENLALFVVLKAFKGVPVGTIQAVDRSSGTDCSVTFNVGEDYLVFAERIEGRLSTSICMGPRLLQPAYSDLRYLENWLAGRTPSEVLGTVFPPASRDTRVLKAFEVAMRAASVQLISSSGKVFTTSVDREGAFALSLPLGGLYSISIKSPDWVTYPLDLKVDIPLHACKHVSLTMRPDGQVMGTAFESDGKPARDVLLKLIAVGDFGDTLETVTDDLGRFHFRGVLMDDYRLGVNPEALDDPSTRVPYAPTFYPGVPEESKAAIIRVDHFSKVRLSSDFKLPPRARPRTIRVSVQLENGEPLEGASVSCTPGNRPYWRKTLTSAKGIVSFPAMDNVVYIVDVDIPSYHGLVKAGYERSQWQRVGPGNGTSEVKFVFRKTKLPSPGRAIRDRKSQKSR